MYLKHSKIGISQNVKSLPRGAEFFLSWRRFFAGPVRSPRRHGLASPRRVCPSANVTSLDFTLCDHELPFITIQCPLSSGGTAFRGNGDAKRASALAAAAINSVATIALVFINESLTGFGKLYCHDESDVFPRADDQHVPASGLLKG